MNKFHKTSYIYHTTKIKKIKKTERTTTTNHMYYFHLRSNNLKIKILKWDEIFEILLPFGLLGFHPRLNFDLIKQIKQKEKNNINNSLSITIIKKIENYSYFYVLGEIAWNLENNRYMWTYFKSLNIWRSKTQT